MGFAYTPLDIRSPNYQKKINHIYRRTESLRGFIINSSIELEWYLNNLIRSYYAKDSPQDRKHVKNKFWTSILNHLTFSRKIKIIKEMGLHKKKQFKKKYSTFIKRLDEVRDIRNGIAHNTFSVGLNLHVYLEKDLADFKYKRRRIITKKFRKIFRKEIIDLMNICSILNDYVRSTGIQKK